MVTQTKSCNTSAQQSTLRTRSSSCLSQSLSHEQSMDSSSHSPPVAYGITQGLAPFLRVNKIQSPLSIPLINKLSRLNNSHDNYDYDITSNEFSQLWKVTTSHPQSPQALLSKQPAKQHSSVINAVQINKGIDHVYYCNNLKMPKDCKDCEKTYFKVACHVHHLLPCSNHPRLS